MVEAADRNALALLRRRNAYGFDMLYAAYAPRLHAFLRRLSGSHDLADDLLQHTFLRLAESGPELRPDSDVRAWLYVVARNAYFSQVRRAPEENIEMAAQVTSRTVSERLDARLFLGDVERALGLLRAEDRELLLLIGSENFEQEEVAKMLGIQRAALRQRVARARSRLWAALEPTSNQGVLAVARTTCPGKP